MATRGSGARGVSVVAAIAAALGLLVRAPLPSSSTTSPATYDPNAIAFVQAKYFGATPAGQTRTIRNLVLHDAECAENFHAARSVAAWFQNPVDENGRPLKVSAHYTADDVEIIQCVRDVDVAFAAPPLNDTGLHLELAGYARQSAAEWDDPYSRSMLSLVAAWAADKCNVYGLPIAFVDAEGLRRGEPGITTHAAVSKAFGQSTHTDPGPDFPMDAFLARVRSQGGIYV